MNTINKYENYFPPFVRPFYKEPLVVKSADDVYITDINDRTYLDLYAGVATVSLGHGNKSINRKVIEQIERFGHISYIYEFEEAGNYAENLVSEFPDNLEKIFFVNSGSEALDLAIILARKAACSDEIFVFDLGYHGGSYLSKFATGIKTWQPEITPPEGINYISSPHCHHCSGYENCNDGGKIICLEEFEVKCEKLKNSGVRPILVMEPLLGVGGVLLPPVDFFEKLDVMIRKYNILLICDEVQTGFGRLGQELFAVNLFNLNAEIVCLGKAIANGYPLGAVIMSNEIAQASKDLLHFSTFGGNPVSIAAASQVLKIMKSTNIVEKTFDYGEYFLQKLKEEFSFNEEVRDIRGRGFFLGIEFKTMKKAIEVLENAKNLGLLLGIGGLEKNVIRIEPSMTLKKEHIDEAVNILKKII